MSLHLKFMRLGPSAFNSMKALDTDVVIASSKKKPTFYHSGDYGDIIYALPAIRALGGGTLLLGPEIGLKGVGTRMSLDENKVAAIAPLLEQQPYIDRVQFTPRKPLVDYDLNRFREYLEKERSLIQSGHRQLNLAEAHLYTFKCDLNECNNAWILVDRAKKAIKPVLLHRSHRWRNPDFPWDKVLKRYGNDAAFVGLKEEHEDFQKEWNCQLPYLPTSNFLELARLLASCELFIGNQSSPYSVAEGLKINTLQEVWPEGPNCLFGRNNAVYGEGKIIYIPDLRKSMIKEKVNCPCCGSDKATPCNSRHDLVTCDSCSVVYLRTRLTKRSMVEKYQTYADGESHMRIPESIHDMKSSGLRRDYFMQEIENNLPVFDEMPEKLRLLDIGCGWGAFLMNAREKGFDAQGIEVGAKSANFAHSTLGFKVGTEQVEDTEWKESTFHVVTLLHTLEHLPHTEEAVRKIHDILEPNGLVCGLMPNYDSFCHMQLREKWEWLDPDMHYTHFTPSTLRSFMERLGFEEIKVWTHLGDYNKATLVKLVTESSTVPLGSHEIEGRIEQLGSQGNGEEIRFIFKKK